MSLFKNFYDIFCYFLNYNKIKNKSSRITEKHFENTFLSEFPVLGILS